MKKRLIGAFVMLLAITSLPAQQITRAEYFFNTDPGQGLATALPVIAGDSVTINNNIGIPANLQAGINTLFVRTANNNGVWSFPASSLLWISGAPQKINAFEYFFDADPGYGKGTKISFASADSISITQNITIPDSLRGGLHLLFVRIQNEQGTWSAPEAYLISVQNGFVNLDAGEYFFDTDPGFGSATPIVFSTPVDSITLVQSITVPALTNGTHQLYVRTKNTKGTWSFAEVYTIKICSSYGPKSVFGYYINGNEVYFSDSSVNTENRKWLFGDNTTDTSSNPRHVYANGNNYTVALITANSCGNDTLTKTIPIYGVQSIYTNTAPQTGSYSGYIKGAGFTPGSKVRLLKDGSINIPADTTVFVNPSLLKVLFKNSNEILGKYDVKVMTPSLGEETLTNGLEIVPAIPANIWSRLDGRKELLINRWTSFRVVIGNKGNTTAWGVPVVIKMPGHVKAKLINRTYDSTLSQALIDSTHDHFFVVRDSIRHDSTTFGYFLYPYLEAGQTATIEFEVKTSSLAKFAIRTATGNPFYTDDNIQVGGRIASGHRNNISATGSYIINNPLKTNSFCDPPPCVKCLLDILGNAPGAGCAIGIYSFGCTLGGIFSGGGSPGSNVFDVVVGAAGTIASCGLAGSGSILEAVASGIGGASDGFGYVNDCGNCLNDLIPDTITVRFSWDPNVKAGPSGYGSQNYTRWQDPFNYTIHFENLASASAPASEVTITDYLDSAKLDLSSLRITAFGFGDTTVEYITPDTLLIRDVDLRPNKNAIVRVTGTLDSVNKLSFRFTTFDPATMRLTTSISDGFLNPNVNGTEGFGYVSFQVNVKPDLLTGTIINNIATVQFDNNPQVITPLCFNTIDKQKPAGNILPITETINDSTYIIRWTGSDAHAGLFFNHIYVSINDSAYKEVIRSDIDSARFVVKPAHTYKFYSIAQDYVGNIEDAPGVPDQTLAVISPLPVTLLEFKVDKRNKFSLLQWSTSSEYSNRGFEIQRSGDGINFSRIGWVASQSNPASVHNYSFIDSMPARGKNFYRLKQIDIDNGSKFSEIRQVNFEETIDFTIYPDPAKEDLTIQFSDDKGKKILIKDIFGRTVWSKADVRSDIFHVTVKQFVKGVFIILVIDDSGKQTVRKFIKE